MDPEEAQRHRERALLTSGRALTILERGAGDAAVTAATDQARAATAELRRRGCGRSPLADLLDQLLAEINHCRLPQVRATERVEAALHRVQTAWFTTLTASHPRT